MSAIIFGDLVDTHDIFTSFENNFVIKHKRVFTKRELLV